MSKKANPADRGRQVSGRLAAKRSRGTIRPENAAEDRKNALAQGRKAASDLIKGTIAKNRDRQSTDKANAR